MIHGHRPGRHHALAERRERLLEQQAALASLTKSTVFHGEDLEETIRHVTGMAARLMRIERVSLWRYTEARTAIRCIDLYERRWVPAPARPIPCAAMRRAICGKMAAPGGLPVPGARSPATPISPRRP